MSIGLGIGVQRPKQLRSIYSVNGKVPGFAADFIKNKYPSYSSFASAITHSRSTNATMTDGYGPELVTNGSYSDGTTGWTANQGFTVNNGVATVTTTSGSAAAYIQQSFSTVNGKTYILTYNLVARVPAFKVSIDDDSFTNQGDIINANYNDLGQGSIVFTATSSTAYLRFIANTTTAGKSVSFDNVSVREMPVLKWAPHNLLQYSEDLGNWTNFNTTDSLNQIAAPDGTTTADKVVEDSSSAVHNIYQTGITVVSGVDYTFCTFVKQGEYKWVQLSFALSNSTFTANDFANFDVNAGTVGTTGSGATATIEDVGSGWYKCSVTATAAASASSGATICLTDNTDASSRNPSYVGDGSSGIYVWGMHFNRGDLGGMVDNPDQPLSRASYVPTTSSAVYLPRVGHHVFNGNAWVNEGLLAESEARTNILPKSGEFSTWAQNNATTTDNAEISPDGMTSASTIITNTVNGEHFVQYNLSSATGTFTDSVYVKADGYKLVFIRPVHVGATEGNTQSIRFDIEAGTVLAAPSGTTGTIQDVGNGWYRIAATFTISGTITGAYGFRLQILSDSGGSSFAGDGTSGIQVYGAQREEASTPSSLIPTSGSSVTRAAETFTIPSANLPWPSPQYIGSERLTGSWAVPTGYDNTTSSTGTSVSTTGGSTQSRVFLPIDGVDAGEVYQVTLTVNSTSTGNVDFYFRDGPTGGSGTLLLNQLAIPSGGSFTGHVAAASGDMVVLLIGASGADYDVSISVREINPLSVSIAMDGRISHRGVVDTFFRWLEDGNNYINNVYWTDYRFIAAQKDGTTYDQVASDVNLFSGDLLEPYNFASRHGSTFLNGAVDGVAFTANTTPTALPDLSATDLSLAYDYMGTIGTFRVWDKDLGDTGLVEATNPSLEPSLSLTFEGVGTNSFVVNDWSE